jgi:hypothetical protein
MIRRLLQYLDFIRKPEERHQMDDDQPPVRVRMWLRDYE